MSAPTRETTMDVDELTRELKRQRDIAAARRADELERMRSETEHAIERANVDETARNAEMARAERKADALADAEVRELVRKTRADGQRARVAAAIARSGEARAARLERTRALNLRVLIPVLIGFGAWSTAGVQEGGARLMDVTSTDPTWWALWALEPVLIGVVVWVIIARAQLATAGGKMADGAERIAAGALTTSVLLNLVAAMPATSPEGGAATLAVAGSMLAHAIGPVGAAATAYLIGVVDASVSGADPWADSGTPAPVLADLTASEDAAGDAATPRRQRSRARQPRTADNADPGAPARAPASSRTTKPAAPPSNAKPADGTRSRRGSQRDEAWNWYVAQRESGVENPAPKELAAAITCHAGQARKLKSFCESQWNGWDWYTSQRQSGGEEPTAVDLAAATGVKSAKDADDILRFCQQRWAEERRDIHLVGDHAA